jgi:hypothetical protein
MPAVLQSAINAGKHWLSELLSHGFSRLSGATRAVFSGPGDYLRCSKHTSLKLDSHKRTCVLKLGHAKFQNEFQIKSQI